MGQVEELPDDFDEALDLNKLAASANKQPKTRKSGGPRNGSENRSQAAPAASEEPKTADEIMQMMNSTPLFMTNLDNAADAGTQPL